MSLKYKAEKGAIAVGADRSTTQCRMFKIVPELVAWVAVVGNRRCRSVWFAMVIFVAVENDGLRSPGPSCMPSATISSTCPKPSFRSSSSLDTDPFDGVALLSVFTFALSEAEANVDSGVELPALDAGTAGAFLRDLNENFFGGLNVLRVVWSFSESVLMACWSQIVRNVSELKCAT
jgi:hypothetical protein